MKLNKFFVGLLGAMALTACSSDENMPDAPVTPGDAGEARFMSVTIRNTGTPGTRAEGDQTVETGNTYEEGLGGENAVSKVRFYFFQGDGSAFPVAANNLNYVEVVNPEVNTDLTPNMPNVEKVYQSVLVLNGQGVDFTKLKSMVAVVNYKSTLDNTSKGLSDLQSIIEDYSISAFYNNKSADIPNMIMTSAVYNTSEEFEGCETFISPSKLKMESAEALADPVDVYVERVLAKVRVTAKWDSDKVTTQTVDGSVLVMLKDKDGNLMKSSDDKQLYVKFNGWGIQTFTDKSYLFKNIDKSSLWGDLGDWWNHAAYHRSYWALNPAGVQYLNATHSAATGKIATVLTTTSNNVTTTIQYDGDFAYVQENAGDRSSDGHKTNYEPSSATSNRTQVYLNATIVDETGAAVSLAKFGSEYYTEAGVKTAMLGTVNRQIWIKKTSTTSSETETTTDSEWVTIPESFVTLVNAQDIDKADVNSETSKRYLSYIQLKSKDATNLFTGEYAGYDQKFYDANHNVISIDKVNETLAGMPGAKVWESGMTYYYTDIKHLNTGTGNEEKGMYGVVRNHIYEVVLESVTGLGTPVLIPDKDQEKEIIPQKPGDDEYFLGARLNILSWRVVPNNTTLDW